jgi:hypothetical protein
MEVGDATPPVRRTEAPGAVEHTHDATTRSQERPQIGQKRRETVALSRCDS